jgi:transposase
MKIIGIDVSKNKLDCAWFTDVETDKLKNKVFMNTPKAYQQLIDWALKQSQVPLESIQFVMEATGIYHEALAYALYQAGAKVSVVNPAQIRNYAKSLGTRTKTDKKDSVVITRFGIAQAPRLWQPEPEAIRTLKALISRLNAIEKDIQRENNRLEKAEIAHATDEVVTSIHTVLEQLEKEKKRLEDLIDQHIDTHPQLKKDRTLLESIPGVGPVVSRMMLALIHSRDFKTASQCAAFIGLVPMHHESGSSVRGRPHLTKAGSAAIRAKLYMAAVVAKQHNPDIKYQYERLLKNGKVKMSALCAAMRKLVHICFGVIKHQQMYQAQVV